MKNYSRSYNRDVSRRKALRKQRIANAIYRRSWISGDDFNYYDNLHQYSKNKIHCSCSGCAKKTNNKGHNRYKYGNYAPSKNWKAADIRRISAMDFDEFETFGIIRPRRHRCRFADM